MADNETHVLSGSSGNITDGIGLDTTAEHAMSIDTWTISLSNGLINTTPHGSGAFEIVDRTRRSARVDIVGHVLVDQAPGLANLGQGGNVNLYFDEDNVAGYTGIVKSDRLSFRVGTEIKTNKKMIFFRLSGMFSGTIVETGWPVAPATS